MAVEIVDDEVGGDKVGLAESTSIGDSLVSVVGLTPPECDSESLMVHRVQTVSTRLLKHFRLRIRC